MRKIAVALIKAYRYILSPWIGNQCRFYPTCSHYAEEAFTRFGFFKGLWLTLCRLLKCHPWHPGGIDLVPSTNDRTQSPSTAFTHIAQQAPDLPSDRHNEDINNLLIKKQ